MIGASDARVIRTPDQRLRVFVSSTLKELAPERLAARAAIERLHLAPVMFELGARPHPPRELYRAYLEQSDVFVGIYWQQYGWIAPDEEISGLEDEYRLASREMPKLVYVKQPAEREQRLAGLLARIRDDDTTSYKCVLDRRGARGAPRGRPRRPARRAVRRVACAGRPRATRPSPDPPMTRPTTSPPLPDEVLGARPTSRRCSSGWAATTPAGWSRSSAPGGIGKTPARHRGRAPRTRPVRPGDVRAPRARARSRRRAARRRAGARRAGHGERPDARATRGRASGAARPPRARQLRAGDRRRLATSRRCSTELPDATVHGDESGPAPRARGAGLRRRAARPSAGPARACRLAEIADAPAVRLFLTARTPPTRASTLTAENADEVARICRALDGRAARDRARGGVHPRAHAGGDARETRRDAVPARHVRPRHARAPAHDARHDRVEHRPARPGRAGPVRAPRRLRRATSASTPSRPWPATSPGRTTCPARSSNSSTAASCASTTSAGLPFFSMLVPVRELAAAAVRARVGCPGRASRACRVLRAASPSRSSRCCADPPSRRAVERLEAERDNVRAGFRHLIMIGEVDTVADAVWRLLLLLVDPQPACRPRRRGWTTSSRPAWSSHDRTRAIAHHVLVLGLAVASRHGGRHGAARARPRELFRAAGDRFGEAAATTVLGIACATSATPDLDRAEELQRRAFELVAAERRCDVQRACSAASSGSIELLRGRPAEALAMFDEVIADARAHRRPLRRDDRARRTPDGRGSRSARPAPSSSPGTSSSRCGSATRRASGTRSRAWPPARSRRRHRPGGGAPRRGGHGGRARDGSTSGPTPPRARSSSGCSRRTAASEFEDARARAAARCRAGRRCGTPSRPASVRAVEHGDPIGARTDAPGPTAPGHPPSTATRACRPS